jgi:predicted Zn-dependent protease
MYIQILSLLCVFILLSSIMLHGGLINAQNEAVAQRLFSKDVSYIELYGSIWNKDGISVQIIVDDPETPNQSNMYKSGVIDAIMKWSQDLKSYSGNHNAWNFNIVTNPPADIEILLKGGDPQEERCYESGGSTTYDPVKITVYTSCGNSINSREEVYRVALHEFGHALGLAHAFFIKDLMCSHESMNNRTLFRTCTINDKYYAPTIFDLNALLYLYEKDGFSEPNNDRVATEGSIYTYKMLLEDSENR